MANPQEVLTSVMNFAAQCTFFAKPQFEEDPINPPMSSFSEAELQEISRQFHQWLLNDGIRTFVAPLKMRGARTWSRLAGLADANQTL